MSYRCGTGHGIASPSPPRRRLSLRPSLILLLNFSFSLPALLQFFVSSCAGGRRRSLIGDTQVLTRPIRRSPVPPIFCFVYVYAARIRSPPILPVALVPIEPVHATASRVAAPSLFVCTTRLVPAYAGSEKRLCFPFALLRRHCRRLTPLCCSPTDYACLALSRLEHSHANRINSVHLQLITTEIVGATWSRAQCSPNPLLLLLLYTSCWVGAPL